MKRLFIVVVAFVSLAVLAQRAGLAQHDVVAHTLNTHTHVSGVVPAAHALDDQTDPATITVYVTRTGAKYHRDGCRYLSRSRIPMSLKDAAKRYGPCSVCKPPTLR